MILRRREKQVIDALTELAIHLRGVREERKAVVVVTGRWVLFRENRDLTAGGAQPTLPRIGVDLTGRVTSDVAAANRGVRYVPTAVPQFSRTERMRIDVPVETGTTAVTAEILDRAGKPINVPVHASTRVEGSLTWRPRNCCWPRSPQGITSFDSRFGARAS